MAETLSGGLPLTIPTKRERNYDVTMRAAFVDLGAHDHTTNKGTQIPTGGIADSSITTAKLNDLAVTTAKLNDLSVTEGKINTGAVTVNKLGALAVTAAKIDALAVTTAKIDSLAVTTAKIDNLAVTAAKLAPNAVDTTVETVSAGTVVSPIIANTILNRAGPVAYTLATTGASTGFEKWIYHQHTGTVTVIANLYTVSLEPDGVCMFKLIGGSWRAFPGHLATML